MGEEPRPGGQARSAPTPLCVTEGPESVGRCGTYRNRAGQRCRVIGGLTHREVMALQLQRKEDRNGARSPGRARPLSQALAPLPACPCPTPPRWSSPGPWPLQHHTHVRHTQSIAGTPPHLPSESGAPEACLSCFGLYFTLCAWPVPSPKALLK